MIVGTDRRKTYRYIDDLEQGDLVRRMYHRGVGIIESTNDGWAWVSWKDGKRDYLPFVCLRRVAAGGAQYDRRGK